MFLCALGFLVGAVGTLIGVGGGFMLVPILLFLYPERGGVWIASASMWLVACNATSGSIAYYRRGTVHLRAAFAFVLACLPGSILGVWIERFVSRPTFELIFGVALLFYALTLFFRPAREERPGEGFTAHSPLSASFYARGILVSFLVGFVASFLGIGGGVVHVPLLANVLGFPVHLATGTSHMILAVTAWFTTAIHIWNGDFQLSDPTFWYMGGGAVLGAQLGAFASRRVSGPLILRLLAVALFLVGVRLIYPILSGTHF